MAQRLDLDELHRHLAGFKTAMLTTVTAQGYVHSRPMMTQERTAEADLWFVSALNTEKIAEIQAHPLVGVIYFHEADNSYVSLSGPATVITDRDLIRARWQDNWRAWFPGGPEQESLCMIRVDPHEAEYWEPAGGRIRIMFEAARATLTGEHAQVKPPTRGRVP